jgi:hypothetical protein
LIPILHASSISAFPSPARRNAHRLSPISDPHLPISHARTPPTPPLPFSHAPSPGYATTYKILKQGDGKAIAKGNTATVHATGVVKETGKQFWSTKDAGQQPFTYQAGVGG